MRAMPVFVFALDGVEAFRTVDDAAASMAAVDVDNGEYEALFTLYDRIVTAAAANNDVVLTVTDRRDEPDLDRRVREWAPRVGLTCPLEDRRAVANEPMPLDWEARWPKRPRWLARRLHGSEHRGVLGCWPFMAGRITAPGVLVELSS